MKYKNKARAFTLIEALVAITVLVVGVLGPLTIAARGISEGFFARNQIAANYLAQEAFEIILQIRQNNYPGDVWEGLSGYMNVNGRKFGVDPANATLTFCDDANLNCFLVFDKDAGHYKAVNEVEAGDRTGPVFKRAILLEPVQVETGEDPGGPTLTVEGVRVTVFVDWNNFSLPRILKLTGNLYRY